MPKKLTLIPTLITLAISTLSQTVPTFAGATVDYTITDVSNHYAEFIAEVETTCGEYNTDSTYSTCLNTVTTRDKNENPGEYAAMRSFDRIFKGAAVTAYNPYAGTMRFYINTSRMITNYTTNFQNLTIFWTDKNYIYNQKLLDFSTQETYAWRIGDAILNGDEIPEEVHVMYASDQDKENWFTSGIEQRVVMDDESNFLTDAYPKLFFILGYDVDGNRSIAVESYGGSCNVLAADSECRLHLYYTPNNGYISTDLTISEATAEDLALIERKEIIKEAKTIAKEAEARAKAAEDAAREAKATAREAEARAEAAEARAEAAEAAAREAEARAATAETTAREAEAIAREMQSIADEATAAARDAEAAAREAESVARAAEAATREAKAAAAEAVDMANQMAETARLAIEEANRVVEESARMIEEANRTVEQSVRMVEEVSRAADDARQTAEEATRVAEEAKQSAIEANRAATEVSETSTSRINELKEKIANLSSQIASSKAKTEIIEKFTEKTTEKVIEKPITIATNSSPITNPTSIVATTDTAKTNTSTEEPTTKEDYVDIPLAAKEEKVEFPWWIIAFIFSGIALILWWAIPIQKKSENLRKKS